jgi:hypothetical protein
MRSSRAYWSRNSAAQEVAALMRGYWVQVWCSEKRRWIIAVSAAVPPRRFFHWDDLGMAALYQQLPLNAQPSFEGVIPRV